MKAKFVNEDLNLNNLLKPKTSEEINLNLDNLLNELLEKIKTEDGIEILNNIERTLKNKIYWKEALGQILDEQTEEENKKTIISIINYISELILN